MTRRAYRSRTDRKRRLTRARLSRPPRFPFNRSFVFYVHTRTVFSSFSSIEHAPTNFLSFSFSPSQPISNASLPRRETTRFPPVSGVYDRAMRNRDGHAGASEAEGRRGCRGFYSRLSEPHVSLVKGRLSRWKMDSPIYQRLFYFTTRRGNETKSSDRAADSRASNIPDAVRRRAFYAVLK